jgi:hypothetical protein
MTASTASAARPLASATPGLRRHQRQACSKVGVRRALMGRSLRNGSGRPPGRGPSRNDGPAPWRWLSAYRYPRWLVRLRRVSCSRLWTGWRRWKTAKLRSENMT